MTATLCKCSHLIDGHIRVRDGWLCGITMCGCPIPRPDDQPWTPARLREGDSYDPSPEPIDRSVQ